MKPRGVIDPRQENFYNPHSDEREALRRAQARAEMDGTPVEEVQEKFDDMAATTLRDMEETGSTLPRDTREKHSATPVIHRGKPAKVWQLFTSKRVRGKSSVVAVVFLLFGGGGFLTILFAPSTALVAMKEVLTQSLNDQLHAVDRRSASILRAKMKSVSDGSCGTVKICKGFAKMSDEQVRDFQKHNSGTTIERDRAGRVTKISFENDKTKLTITSADQLTRALAEHPAFLAAWTQGYNPEFKSMSDPVARKVLAKNKATKNQKITGKTDEERQKSLNRIAGGLEDTGGKTLTPIKDKDGNTTGYIDEDGNPIDKNAVEAARAMEERVENAVKNGGTIGVLKNSIARGVQVHAAADIGCMLFNSIRRVSALSKMVKMSQAIRFSLALVLTPADRIKAGDADEALTNFSANNLMATSTTTEVIDESKINQTAAIGSKPPTTTTAIGNAFDSKGFKLANGETISKLNTREARFSLGGGGSPTVMDTATQDIARVVNGGNADPNALSKKCRYIQSPFVRVGAFAAGIATGVASLGVFTLIQGAASFALQLAAPLIEAQLGEMIAGDVFKDIEGDDSGNAAYVGMAGLSGSIAQERGMAPVSGQGGADYLAKNKQTVHHYASIKRYMARTTPFDLNNPYSFLGSMAVTLVPTAWQSRSSAGVAAMNIAALVPKTFANILQPSAGAVPNNYFGQCNDMMYKSLDIKAGPFCEVRYWMSDEELNMDPLENARWMADTGNIDPSSETGEAKDNGEDWNYVKFLDQCAHREMGWGEIDAEDPSSGDGSKCIDPAYEAMNKHFRVYTMDRSIQISMDEKDQNGQAMPGTTGFPDGKKGPVGKNGWAFPTVASSTVVHNFQDAPLLVDKDGVVITAKDESKALGQPIFAAYDGVVMAAGPSVALGNWIVVEHTVNGRKMSTVYGHMNNDGVFVRPGDKVKAGQQIGRIGDNMTTEWKPYLAFQLWQGSPLSGGKAVDPALTIETARASAGGHSG